MTGELMFIDRPRYEGAEGRRVLAEHDVISECPTEILFVLWSGCDRDREPIVEIKTVEYYYPAEDSQEDGVTTKTIGWVGIDSFRHLFASLDDPLTSRAKEADHEA